MEARPEGLSGNRKPDGGLMVLDSPFWRSLTGPRAYTRLASRVPGIAQDEVA